MSGVERQSLDGPSKPKPTSLDEVVHPHDSDDGVDSAEPKQIGELDADVAPEQMVIARGGVILRSGVTSDQPRVRRSDKVNKGIEEEHPWFGPAHQAERQRILDMTRHRAPPGIYLDPRRAAHNILRMKDLMAGKRGPELRTLESITDEDVEEMKKLHPKGFSWSHACVPWPGLFEWSGPAMEAQAARDRAAAEALDQRVGDDDGKEDQTKTGE